MDRTKNTLGDLNNMLFMMAEEIMDDEGTNPKEFERKMKRAKALSSIGSTIVANANLIYKAACMKNNNGTSEVPRLLTGNPNDKNYIGN